MEMKIVFLPLVVIHLVNFCDILSTPCDILSTSCDILSTGISVCAFCDNTPIPLIGPLCLKEVVECILVSLICGGMVGDDL